MSAGVIRKPSTNFKIAIFSDPSYGQLEVFAPGNVAYCNRWQEAPNNNVWRREGWNKKPRIKETAPQVGLTWLEAALNFEDRLEVLAFGDDGALWHSWQLARRTSPLESMA
jgi:hypothetical protein